MSPIPFASLLSAICLVGLTLTPIAATGHISQEFVDAHNKYRAEVGSDKLFWDEELANYAKKYAETKIDTCEMVHSDSSYGENLALANGDLSPADAVKAWADEKKFYDYKSNTCVGGECRHYTQLVWKTSMYVGCASVKCKGSNTFVGCNYNPPGNFVGDRPY